MQNQPGVILCQNTKKVAKFQPVWSRIRFYQSLRDTKKPGEPGIFQLYRYIMQQG